MAMLIDSVIWDAEPATIARLQSKPQPQFKTYSNRAYEHEILPAAKRNNLIDEEGMERLDSATLLGGGSTMEKRSHLSSGTSEVSQCTGSSQSISAEPPIAALGRWEADLRMDAGRVEAIRRPLPATEILIRCFMRRHSSRFSSTTVIHLFLESDSSKSVLTATKTSPSQSWTLTPRDSEESVGKVKCKGKALSSVDLVRKPDGFNALKMRMEESKKEQKQIRVELQSAVMVHKAAVVVEGDHLMAFDGSRVKVTSTKNMALCLEGSNEISLQFGKVGEEVFILDFKGPHFCLDSAFAVGLAQL